MTLSPNEAAQALGEIARTEQRSAEAHEYANASPHFVMWGVIWIMGYTSSYLLPHYGFRDYVNWPWFLLTMMGITGALYLGRRQSRRLPPAGQIAERARGFRIGMSFLAMWLFVVATFVVMRPVHPVATGAFIPLLAALAYSIFGIWRGLRFLYAGIAVAVLTVGGFLYLREFFLLWMAFVGGGSLILVGLWLKKV
jgi:hypothetical protein